MGRNVKFAGQVHFAGRGPSLLKIGPNSEKSSHGQERKNSVIFIQDCVRLLFLYQIYVFGIGYDFFGP